METTTLMTSSIEFFEKGTGFLNRVHKMRAAEKKTTPILLYSITSMAIENFVMFLLTSRNKMPYNHTMVDLIEALEECELMTDDIKQGMLSVEKVFNICDLNPAKIKPPDETDVSVFLDTADRLFALADQERIAAGI